MFKILLVVGLVVAVLLYGYVFYQRIGISKQLVAKAIPYTIESNDFSKPMLVLGDSTAVGVGATDPKDTNAAQLQEYRNMTYVENYAQSGARTVDLEKQIKEAKLERYALIFIAIGANDIIRFAPASQSAIELDTALGLLPPSDEVIVLTAGNVGGTPFFPWFLRPFYTKLNLKYHDAFSDIVKKRGYTYVNLYEDPSLDLIAKNPDIYLSEDTLHPSSEGYAVWFEKIKAALK